MPIDPRIALGYQPPQMESPVNMMLTAQKMQAGQQENALRQAQMENYQAEAARRNALLPFETAEAKAKSDKAERELAVAEMDRQLDRVALVSNQNGWTAWRNGIVEKDPSYAAYIPEDFTPDNKNSALTTAKVIRDRLVKGLHFADTGGAIQGLDPYTNQPVGAPIVKTATPGELLRAQRESADTTAMTPDEIDYYANLYNQTQTLPSLGMGAAPIRQKILSRAAQLGMAGGETAAEGAANVAANAQTRAAEKRTLAEFTSGVASRTVRANNTALNHIETMERLADDLANTDIRIVNTAKTAFQKALGGAAPTNFDAAKQIVAAEVVKAVVQNGGSMRERGEAEANIARANSPEQLKGVLATYRELLAGQLASLEQSYATGTNRKDFRSRLSPATRKLLESRDEAPVPAPGTAPPTDLAAAAAAELARRKAK